MLRHLLSGSGRQRPELIPYSPYCRQLDSIRSIPELHPNIYATLVELDTTIVIIVEQTSASVNIVANWLTKLADPTLSSRPHRRRRRRRNASNAVIKNSDYVRPFWVFADQVS